MAKKDLFQEALRKKLIPADSKLVDYKAAQLKAILSATPDESGTDKGTPDESGTDKGTPDESGTDEEVEETPKEDLFKKALEQKAIPIGAKKENYNDSTLKTLMKNHKETIAKSEKETSDHKKANEETKKEAEKKAKK